MPRPPISLILGRARRCECPRCGKGPLFIKDVRMYRHCPVCGLSYYPESGFYLGGMILNYIFTVWVVIALYLISLLLPNLLSWSINAKILLWMIFTAALSLSLWRHTRSLWLALNYWLEPHESDPSAKTDS
jgi:uncharacterized protein (DUF983 family)